MNAEFPPDRPLDRLVDFYQTLTPEGVARFPEFYADDAYFKDPFNEVRGVAAIQGGGGGVLVGVALRQASVQLLAPLRGDTGDLPPHVSPDQRAAVCRYRAY